MYYKIGYHRFILGLIIKYLDNSDPVVLIEGSGGIVDVIINSTDKNDAFDEEKLLSSLKESDPFTNLEENRLKIYRDFYN